MRKLKIEKVTEGKHKDGYAVIGADKILGHIGDNFRVDEITEGPDKGNRGIFSVDGNTLVGLVDDESMKHIGDLAAVPRRVKAEEFPPIPSRPKADVTPRTSVDELNRIANSGQMGKNSLEKKLGESRVGIDALPEDLSLRVEQLMTETDTSFTEALLEVTRDPKMAKLYNAHKAKHTAVLAE